MYTQGTIRHTVPSIQPKIRCQIFLVVTVIKSFRRPIVCGPQGEKYESTNGAKSEE